MLVSRRIYSYSIAIYNTLEILNLNSSIFSFVIEAAALLPRRTILLLYVSTLHIRQVVDIFLKISIHRLRVLEFQSH